MEGLIHILVVDDDERLRSLISSYLKRHGYMVSLAGDALEARELMGYIEFDLMILDHMMPQEDGFTFLKSLRSYSKLPILMLTAMGESEHRIQGFELGADDYLTKPFEPRELLLRIESILRRLNENKSISMQNVNNLVTFSNFSFDVMAGRLRDHEHNHNQQVHLTGNELKLLTYLVQHQGQVISRARLAHWAKIKGGDRAVDVQVARLRGKIEADPKQPIHLCTMHGQGYVFRL